MAILTYSDNRAVINEKKGADQGIDGIANHLKRRWIGMDITFQSVALILKRLKDSE